ncbi:hypothetical protein PHYBLDRAFT_58572 [Phycomyces blakesleeanus NRRL 1555(-)]|uniref:Uncharacterized protein n=1 Tax=Phycomyces blakesleeanus (strain ATCC 8743b / DSM 1359 / FGSC 10004 / NBRC 33097 / NRRL 1555) TaxID=763407 RepID=A0A162V2H1_PHYB8|nr:hypothetical protein PHYBLDRAFT_58572 [Phycomyces blakesleeanus NRRL 1555(-)]OAD79523.1 hypothetical protein PHYBLDRAFT_58572 [Phycomyces blakesleeanus NRRL 1555(-)]|eukprot:XP_018297563.1 hypothetical protein PHYBLDRAFT_58572 [Phycomyces blakesleeanus NRRL 1555(-)]
MPRPKKKNVNEEQVPVEDKEPQEMTVTSDVNFNNLLKWHDIVDKPARRTYTKTSRTTEWRRRKAKEALTAQGNQQIDQHFLIKDQQETADQSTESIDKQPKGPPIDKLAAIKLAHQDIIKEITPYTRIGPASRAKITIYELCKLSSVERFFRHRIAGDKKMKASEKASAEVWLNESTYRPALIRKYADEYIEFRSIKSP